MRFCREGACSGSCRRVPFEVSPASSSDRIDQIRDEEHRRHQAQTVELRARLARHLPARRGTDHLHSDLPARPVAVLSLRGPPSGRSRRHGELIACTVRRPL